MQHLVGLDRALMEEAGDIRWAPATALCILVSAWWVKGPLFVLAGLVRDVHSRMLPVTALAVMAAVASGDAASGAIKQAVGRPRPPLDDPGVLHAAVALPASSSFPSGHATTAFAAATVLAILRPGLRVPALTLAASVAFSRIYLGVHFVFDVLAGAALGTLIGAAIALATRQALRRWYAARAHGADAPATA